MRTTRLCYAPRPRTAFHSRNTLKCRILQAKTAIVNHDYCKRCVNTELFLPLRVRDGLFFVLFPPEARRTFVQNRREQISDRSRNHLSRLDLRRSFRRMSRLRRILWRRFGQQPRSNKRISLFGSYFCRFRPIISLFFRHRAFSPAYRAEKTPGAPFNAATSKPESSAKVVIPV